MDYYGRRRSLTSFGRKRRKRSSNSDLTKEGDFLVGGSIRIIDKFEAKFEPQKARVKLWSKDFATFSEEETSWHEESAGGQPSCPNVPVLLVGAGLFALAQFCFVLSLGYIFKKWNGGEESVGHPVDPYEPHFLESSDLDSQESLDFDRRRRRRGREFYLDEQSSQPRSM